MRSTPSAGGSCPRQVSAPERTPGCSGSGAPVRRSTSRRPWPRSAASPRSWSCCARACPPVPPGPACWPRRSRSVPPRRSSSSWAWRSCGPGWRCPANLSLALFLAFVATVGGVAVFAVVQLRGIGTGTAALLQWIRLPGRFVASLESPLRDVDAHLRELLSGADRRPRPSDRGAWRRVCLRRAPDPAAAGLAGLPFDPVAAVGIDAFAALISLVTFIIPGSLVVQEGGKAPNFTALGLAPFGGCDGLGITYRLIAFVDIAVGLAALTLLQQRSPTDRAHASRQCRGNAPGPADRVRSDDAPGRPSRQRQVTRWPAGSRQIR